MNYKNTLLLALLTVSSSTFCSISYSGVMSKKIIKTFFIALRNNNVPAVTHLIEKNIDPNLRDELGKTPLMYACRFPDSQNLENLIAAGADLNACDNTLSQKPVLFHAIYWTDEKKPTVPFLITNGADATLRDKNGQTALMHAALYKKIQCAEYLLSEVGVKVNAQDKDGWTALNYGSHPPVKKLLIKYGGKTLKELIAERSTVSKN